MSLDDLYKEVIIDHYKNPRNHGVLDSPDLEFNGHNPLCGDTVTLHIQTDGKQVTDIKFQGEGCSISQASISMMTDKIKGLTPDEVLKLVENFRAMMKGEEDPEIDMGELEVLQGVKQFPARIKCALLGWDTLKQAIGQLKS
ncbi:MAG: SUF system NifU family Fe-S cluster assembly protein [Candidatus Marinimicrobia bacterium]|nr:SUF system NifU family Fe-S cluster assembly protein [Candidatus Neomarinimicrobiota bacterium]